MPAHVREALHHVAMMISGALIGGLAIALLRPSLRSVDPIGISPIILIIVMGFGAIGWYLRTQPKPRTR